MDELIRKKDALDALTTYIYNIYKVMEGKTLPVEDCRDAAESVLDELPTVHPTITHEQAIDYLHETGWLQNHDRILTESKMMMPVQPIIYCEKCLYKKICSWKNQGAEFCSFGKRGNSDGQ